MISVLYVNTRVQLVVKRKARIPTSNPVLKPTFMSLWHTPLLYLISVFKCQLKVFPDFKTTLYTHTHTHTHRYFKFYLFIFGYAGSLLLHAGFLSFWRVETTFAQWGSPCSCCRAQAQESAASAVAVHGLSRPEACGISPDQGSNLCPRIGRRILNHWTTREVTT